MLSLIDLKIQIESESQRVHTNEGEHGSCRLST